MSLDRFNDFFRKVRILSLTLGVSFWLSFQAELLHPETTSIEVTDVSPQPSSIAGGEHITLYPSTHTWDKHRHYNQVAHAASSTGRRHQHRFVLHIQEELTFQPGVINLILGPTASGKTSVLMALLGLYSLYQILTVWLITSFQVKCIQMRVMVAEAMSCPEKEGSRMLPRKVGYSMIQFAYVQALSKIVDSAHTCPGLEQHSIQFGIWSRSLR